MTEHFIYPIGYKILRYYWSMRVVNQRCKYFCSIADVDNRPEFVVEIEEQGFEPTVEGCDYFPYNNIHAFEALLERHEANGPAVAAVLLEPLQGEGGVHPGDTGFFQRLRHLCSERNILLILDEVQVGMGRSGRLWGYEQLGIEPDAFTLAKGLGGGHAIGALLVNAKADVFEPGDHASTFGGNPFACTAGLTVAQEIQRRGLLRNVEERGQQLQQGIQGLVARYPQMLQGVRGWGLLQGLVLHPYCSHGKDRDN